MGHYGLSGTKKMLEGKNFFPSICCFAKLYRQFLGNPFSLCLNSHASAQGKWNAAHFLPKPGKKLDKEAHIRIMA
jgi:hypothetical protein